MEHFTRSSGYREIAERVIREHQELEWLRSVRIDFVESDKEKKSRGRMVFGECHLVKELHKLYIPWDFIVVIYAPNAALLSERQKEILIYHELLHVDISEDGETRKIRPHDVEDFRAVIDRYGLDWVR